jgi:alanine racemase
MDKFLRPNFVEIDLSSLEYNLKKIRRIIEKRKLNFVVKANAYGHGLLNISRFAENKKLCDYFGVSSVEEGIILRENGIKLPILILGSIYPFSNFEYVARYNLIPTISSLSAMDELVKYTTRNNISVKVHLKFETGMNRIGARESSILKMIERSYRSGVKIEGIYSHLSSAEADKEFTLKQISQYNNLVEKLNKRFNFIRHIANSYATVNYRNSLMDMVRCGICIYGGMEGFKQIITWRSKIVFLKTVKKGEGISYLRTYKTPRKSRIATVPCGYGDGYLRALSNKADVIINGKRCRVIGNITMDMFMVDVSDISCDVGDDVIICGGDGKEFISTIELAKKANTIPYEITTLITPRVHRVYKYDK